MYFYGLPPTPIMRADFPFSFLLNQYGLHRSMKVFILPLTLKKYVGDPMIIKSADSSSLNI